MRKQYKSSIIKNKKNTIFDGGSFKRLHSRLAQLVERRTREHIVSGLYRRGFESPAGQLKLLIVFRMRR